MALPSGTVTFLFSDIEGSTRRWEAYPDAMGAALARHDVLMREAIEQCRGYVFKTVGDAFCAAFSSPNDAVRAALTAQRNLSNDDFSAVNEIRVRMALHTGAAHERDRDYFGAAVNRVARLLAIGHGGQVLLSATTAGLLGGLRSDEFSLRNLGSHRLPDLGEPELVHQLAAPNLPDTFPALKSLGGKPNNLPRQLTSFVGRDAELHEIKMLFSKSPLLTLVGTGGSGKTRCAIRAAAELLDEMPDGVWIAELAPLAEGAMVAGAIASALGVRESPNQPLLQTLTQYLQRKQLLLVLDNCEHVIDEARIAASTILRNCPGVRILATSREVLNVSGERIYRVPSLGLASATELFIDRASTRDSHFAPDARQLSNIAEICRRLDGLPLAIELAAARIKILPPEQLLKKLDERFRVLTGGDRSALPRHQTMRAVIDWSYELLSPEERSVFRKISVFAGTFNLNVAGAVCAGADFDELAVLDSIGSLVEKSLVQAVDSAGDERYQLLESTRQYAREKLLACGEYESAAAAHAAAFLSLADEYEVASATSPSAPWFATAKNDLDNWRAALDFTLVDRNDVLTGQLLACALCSVWAALAGAEGGRWTRAAVAKISNDTPPELAAKLFLSQAKLEYLLHRYEAARTSAHHAIEAYRGLGDALGLAWAQSYAASATVYSSPADAVELARSAIETAGDLAPMELKGRLRHGLGIALQVQGDAASARHEYEEARALYHAAGWEHKSATIAVSLAELEFFEGRIDKALELANEAAENFRRFDAHFDAALTLSNVSAYLVALDDYEGALANASKAIDALREFEAAVPIVFALQHVAAAAALMHRNTAGGNEGVQAAQLLGFVDAQFSAHGIARQYTEQQEYERAVDALRDGMGEKTLAATMREGGVWDLERALRNAQQWLSHPPEPHTAA